MIGLLIAERYRLTQILAVGSTTVIFDAFDGDTGSVVTVKFIHPELCTGPGFMARFDAAQRAVAELDHPNIQQVYNWGTLRCALGDAPYVVAEQLGAGSLRDLFDRGRRLSPSQALALSLDVCRGLDHAHRRGFVHSELSPSKLVFGADRRVRIVDLGLAGLLSEQLWRDPSSLPAQIANYAAPEEALGEGAVAASDVYALSLIMIESVTGELPFVVDSTTGTLQARVGRLMPVSADLGPLAAVLEHAGRPEPAERSTAARFGRDLVACAEKLPRPEPLELLGDGLFDATDGTSGRGPDTGDDFGTDLEVEPDAESEAEIDIELAIEPDAEPDVEVELVLDDDLTTELDRGAAGTAMAIDPLLEQPVIEQFDDEVDDADHVELDVDVDDDRSVAAGTGAVVDEAVVEQAAADEVPTEVLAAAPSSFGPPTGPMSSGPVTADMPAVMPAGPIEPDERRGLPRWFSRVVAPLLIVAALAGLIVLAAQVFITPSYTVPDLSGMTSAEAAAEIADNGWEVTLAFDRSDLEPRPDHVIRTVPAAGERLSRSEPFLIVISEGPEFRAFPNLVGLPEAEAVAVLENLALIPVVEQDFDEEMPVGDIVRAFVPTDVSLGPGDDLLPDTEVIIVVSRGPTPRTIPDLIGRPEAEAIAELEGLALVVQISEPPFSDIAPPGTIAVQSPEPGVQVERGSVVTIAISRGPDLVIFPDLSGTNFAQAQALLAEQDLEARLEFGSGDEAGVFSSATIDGQGVRAGQPVRRFAIVSLVFL